MEGVDNSVHTQPNIILLTQPGLYCFLLRCKRDEAEPFMKWVVETVLPREVRKLASTIEEKDSVIALMNDDLQDRDNQIQAIKCENVALQAQRDMHQAQLERCQDTIMHLRTCYVDHVRDPGKDNIIIILRKNTTPAMFHDLPYYIARIEQRKRYIKLRGFDQHFPDHEVIVEISNPNSTHAFNWFEEEGHAERKYNYFRLIDLTREELYAIGVPAILDDEEEYIFLCLVTDTKSFRRTQRFCSLSNFVKVNWQTITGKGLTLFSFLHQPPTSKSCKKNNQGSCMSSNESKDLPKEA